jgi:hypothetical protein
VKAALVIMMLLGGVADANGRARAKPAYPIITNLSVEVEPQSLPRAAVHEIRFAADVSADTATLELTIRDHGGVQRITTTPDRTNLYRPELWLVPGQLQIEIVAIDAAGQRSAPNTWRYVHAKPHQYYRCGLWFVLVLFFIAPLVVIGSIIGLSLLASLRHWRMPKGPGEVVSLLMAEQIARGARRRAIRAAIVVGLGFALAMRLDVPLAMFLIGLVACVPGSGLLASRRVLRALGDRRARAELRTTVLIVRSPNGQARVAAAPDVIARARQHALPTSRVV